MLKVGYRGFNHKRRAAGGGAFTPASISGLQFWLDADAGLAAVALNDPISTFVASFGPNATQSGSARPTKATVVGKVAASFNGTSQYLNLASSLSGVPDFTVCVLGYRALSGQIFTSLGNLGGILPMGPMLYTDGNAYFGPRARFGAKANTSTGWHTMIGIASGTSVALYIDGVDIGISNSPLSTSNDFNTVGIRGANYCQGAIRSVFYYNKALNGTEVSQAHSYLAGL